MLKLPSTPVFGIRFALVVSLFLAILKTVIGLASGSLAILGSALDSLMDMMVSGVNALALKLSWKNSSEKYAYGLGKVQGFAAIFEGVIVLSSWAFLGYTWVMNFLSKKTPDITSIEIETMVLALLWTGLIMWNFLRIAKVNNSLLIRADALHYSSDLVMNWGILIALILTKYFHLWWTDSTFAVGIALWIVWNALPIIWSGITMLLDSSLSDWEIQEIEKILKDEKALESYHYLRTRKSWDDIFIEAHIVFRDKAISLHDAHMVTDSLESALSARFPGAMIMLHPELDDEPEVCEISDRS
jgi:ferrous-iron efflux pump FieF